MTKFISFAAIAALLFGGASMAAAESPNFETKGFPISLHQAQITGLADIEESKPMATLVAAGMPASPHQLAVLSPRRTDMQVAAKRSASERADTSVGR